MKMLPIAVLSLGIASCGYTLTARLKDQAARDFRCDEDITVRSLNWRFSSAEGCGVEGWYTWDGEKWQSILERASFDLECPKQKLQAQQVDKFTFAVAGCSQRATYVLAYPAGEPSWILNAHKNKRKPSDPDSVQNVD